MNENYHLISISRHKPSTSEIHDFKERTPDSDQGKWSASIKDSLQINDSAPVLRTQQESKNSHHDQKQTSYSYENKRPEVNSALARLRSYSPSRLVSNTKLQQELTNYEHLRQQISQLTESNKALISQEKVLKERLKFMQLDQLHYQRQSEMIAYEHKETNKFFKFLNKFNNKLRKSFLGLPATKQKKYPNIVSESHELKFQFKVLLERILQKSFKTDNQEPTSEIINDLKQCWNVANDFRSNVTFLEQEVTKLKLELASQTREIRNRESKHFQEIRQKDETYNTHIRDCEDKIAKQSQQLAKIAQDNSDLECQITSARDLIQKLQSKNFNIEQMQGEIQILSATLSGSRVQHAQQVSDLQKQLNKAIDECSRIKQSQSDELRLMRMENQRKDEFIDNQQLNFISTLKIIHAKIGVCVDNRLDMTLQRAKSILHDVVQIIDQKILTMEEIESPNIQQEVFSPLSTNADRHKRVLSQNTVPRSGQMSLSTVFSPVSPMISSGLILSPGSSNMMPVRKTLGVDYQIAQSINQTQHSHKQSASTHSNVLKQYLI